MATPLASEHRDPQQRFRDLEEAQADLAAALRRRPATTLAAVQRDLGNLNLPANTYADIITETLPVPTGYTRAVVDLDATIGARANNVGTFGVQILAATFAGPAIEQGHGLGNGVAVAVAVDAHHARLVEGLTGTLTLRLSGYTSAPTQGNTGHAHLSGTVTFLR